LIEEKLLSRDYNDRFKYFNINTLIYAVLAQGERQLQKILVGIDGSEHSKRALAEAIKIGKKFEAEITVVNVFYPTPTPPAHEFSHKILEDAKVTLEKEKVKYKLVSVTDTNPSKVIIEMAGDKKFDLVVVGSRGVGAAHALFLGSHSDKISHESQVNVLIVK
jgi:nucleotide-binding universal stress UspA family protein